MSAGIFEELKPHEILKEQFLIIKGLTVTSEIFNDHNSNYTQFSGILPDDKKEMLSFLDFIIDSQNVIFSRQSLTN